MRLQLLEANFDCFVFNGVVCVLVVIDIIVWKLIRYELPYCVFFLCFFLVFGLQEGLQVMPSLTLMIEEMLKMLFVK